MVFITSCNDSWASVPEADAVIKATGFSENIVVETHHSIAFFIAPGKLKIYSGVHMSIPSAFLILSRNLSTISGALSLSRSGLK